MKQKKYRILSIVLVFIIIISSVLLHPFSVYASGGGGGRTFSKTKWEQMGLYDKLCVVVGYVGQQIKAIVNTNDFEQLMKNKEVLDDILYAIDNDKITVTDEGLTIPADLVALIKQALIEYADETNPFTIRQTYRARDIPASTFPSKKIYNTFLAYATSHAVTAFNTYLNGKTFEYKVGDVTPLLKEGGGFVYANKNTCSTINGNWNYEKIIYDYYRYYQSSVDYENTISNENYAYFDKLYVYVEGNTSFEVRYGSDAYLVTPDGGRIRVFKSLAEFMDYSAGQRKVFFGSGFYDFDPADITATWDEINDKIDRMDDILQDILDAITDNPNLSEEELEKLIDELIGKIGEIGGELGDKTDQTNTLLGGISSTLSGIASSLSGYFSSVLSYLDQILEAIKALVWIEAGEDEDDGMSDLFDLIDKIWQDPETGSQEAADTLSGSFAEIASGITKKFPFSIPWDIYNLFRVFSGAPSPDEAAFHTMTLGVEPFTVDNEDLEQDIHEAPYFKLPLRLDSYGIYEEVVIDLADFKTVSTLSRGLLSVLFAVFLIKFTIRIIELFKGGSSE